MHTLKVLVLEDEDSHHEGFINFVSDIVAKFNNTHPLSQINKVELVIANGGESKIRIWNEKRFGNIHFPIELTPPVYIITGDNNGNRKKSTWKEKMTVFPYPLSPSGGLFGPDLVLLDRLDRNEEKSSRGKKDVFTEYKWGTFLSAFQSIGFPGSRVWTLTQFEIDLSAYGNSARKPWVKNGHIEDLHETIAGILAYEDSWWPDNHLEIKAILQNEDFEWSVQLKDSAGRIYKWDEGKPKWTWPLLGELEKPNPEEKRMYVLKKTNLPGKITSKYYNGDFFALPLSYFMDSRSDLHHPWVVLHNLTKALCDAWKHREYVKVRNLYVGMRQFGNMKSAEAIGDLAKCFRETRDVKISASAMSKKSDKRNDFFDPILKKSLSKIYDEFNKHLSSNE